MTEKTVTITEKEYLSLVQDSDLLLALENGGVDNWQWYDDSLDGLYFEKDGKECSFRDLYN